jgi:hypothetical protein
VSPTTPRNEKPRQPDRVLGLDFSAAARSSGANSWLAECHTDGESLRVERLATVSEALDLDTTEREPVLDELVSFLTERTAPTVIGMDFPFSLPAAFLRTGTASRQSHVDANWYAFLTGTPEDWGVLADVSDPRDLYDCVRETAEREGYPLARETDEQHGGQNPAGFRIKTQTFYGISALLRPLVERRGADIRVPPVYRTADADLTVLETYPAAVFDALDSAVREGYKSDDRAGVERRRQNRDALTAAGVTLSDADADAAVATDDALDAVAAAYAAWRDFETAVSASYSERERVEAVIFDGTGR